MTGFTERVYLTEEARDAAAADGIAESNAAQSTFYAEHPRDEARPDADDLTAEELAEHVLHNHGIHNDNWVRTIAQVRVLLVEAIELARS